MLVVGGMTLSPDSFKWATDSFFERSNGDLYSTSAQTTFSAKRLAQEKSLCLQR
jgi:hypothetical protein